MPETSSSPPRSLVQRFRLWVTAPWRLFQERTIAQLILSYVAVVLLVILLFEITVLVMILWSPSPRLLNTNALSIDPYLGERASAFIQWIDPSRVRVVVEGQGIGTLSEEELDRRLRHIVSGSVPGIESVSPLIVETPANASAAILGTDGSVIASSGDWISRGQSVTDLPSGNARSTVQRNMDLAGAFDPEYNALYSMDVEDGITTASHPIITPNGSWIGTFVLRGGEMSNGGGNSRADIARQLSLGFIQSLWIFAIPALIVAIPFGYWRARSMSRRLQRLAGAAEAMAKGNLRTRVNVKRKDEIGRLAESFNTMAEQIHHDDSARRAFISNVSHELRTPVSIIQGTTERLLMRKESSDPALEQPLSVIQHEGNMLIRLIDDLFTMARIEEHNLRLVRSPFAIADVVAEVVEAVRHLAWTQQKISVESLVSSKLPMVDADPQRVRQIINNLVYNALRHTPEGGLIVIQAKELPGMVAVSVSDTGVGIPEEKLDSIFARYYQTRRSKRGGEGSGLGLSIVSQLVQAHGGEVSVASKVGEGTTFTFTLHRAT